MRFGVHDIRGRDEIVSTLKKFDSDSDSDSDMDTAHRLLEYWEFGPIKFRRGEVTMTRHDEQLAALERAAVHQHHAGVLGVDPVERVPNQPVIYDIEPAGERDLRTRRQHHLGPGAVAGGEEVAAVDYRGSQRLAVDHRSGMRTPGMRIGRFPEWHAQTDRYRGAPVEGVLGEAEQRFGVGTGLRRLSHRADASGTTCWLFIA